MSGQGWAAKKDVRGLPISGPAFGSPPPGVGDSGGLSAPRVQSSISAPMGPRGPRMGSYTPPPPTGHDRSSIEMPGRGSVEMPGRTSSEMPGRASSEMPGRAGLSRMNTGQSQARASLDGSRTGKQSLPPTITPRATPKEEDVRSMADVLPQAETAVIRAYLVKHGDQMQAIG